MPASPANPARKGAGTPRRESWLRKHADYQHVYKDGKRQSLPLMTYFFAARASDPPSGASLPQGSRVGLTAGRVLGNAVARNRIKRRMRAAVRLHRAELSADVDLILHPRKAVLEAEFSSIERDVLRAFRSVQTGFR
jgi:ribonuclease P protein component